MKHLSHTALLVLLLLAVNLQAQKFRHKASGNGWRFNFGSGLNFYNINEKHGALPKQRPNFTMGIRRELRATRDYKSFIQIGLDYVTHGLSYQSYYFKPDSVKLYDGKFRYDYNVTINEIHIPVEFKYLLRRVDNSLFSPYLLIGYHFRYLLPGKVVVNRSGTRYMDDHPEFKFRTHLLGEKVNASLCLAAGWQKNRLGTSKGSFFGEVNFQYGFSDYYFTSAYSANAMYINCIQATLLFGAKF